jgi:hypothetical protein
MLAAWAALYRLIDYTDTLRIMKAVIVRMRRETLIQ